ncbi:hypothetical protein [Acinetobacter wuhouensis]|uniref:Uncharacterized protein n=1 Tax=Acinetobacter wuhouensis TaxID=1879050 RepID=A0A4Q7APG6_9GAMM|nr:hypothetical protein [Acinetobacter wuhouensis]RZG47039.1 hypothetical protein EXU28_07580 [Acinetobacter wuhouensis]
MTIPIKLRPDGLGEFEPDDSVPIEHGGTGASSLQEAQDNLGVPQNTDELVEGENNLYFSDIRVQSVILDNLSASDATEINTTDSLVEALAKLQAQINILKNP